MTNRNLPAKRESKTPNALLGANQSLVQKFGASSMLLITGGIATGSIGLVALSSWPLLAVGTAAALVGGGIGLARYIREGHYIRDNSSSQSQESMKLKEIKRSISKLRYEEGFADDNFVIGSVENIEGFEKKYQLYLRQLKNKFTPGELTYNRYLAAGDSLSQALFSLFEELKELLEQIAVFDEKRLRKESDSSIEAENPKLQKLDKLWKRSKDIDSLVVEALSSLDHITMELSQVVTDSTDKKSDVEDIMLQLKTLADRAKKYSAE
ncbi:MAG: hypothetical protein AAF202_13635 [Pseudomonadota bacterium]